MITLFKVTAAGQPDIVAKFEDWITFARITLDDPSIDCDEHVERVMDQLYETCKARGQYWSEGEGLDDMPELEPDEDRWLS